MLHLFNKVYLEFDNNIEINLDRIVISERYGIQMYNVIDKVAYGELMSYGKTYDDVVKESFVGFVSSLKDHSARTGKKVIIYCDKEAYKRVISQWFKIILPNLDFESFKTLAQYSLYNQRIISNSQLSSVYSVDLNSLWEDLGELEEHWNLAKELTEHEEESFRLLDLNYSYEFLLSNYLSGAQTYKDELRKTVHMFLRRWFKEMFTDNRQMVLLNITNRKFQEAMGIDHELVDITRIDPLSGIDSLESYADDEIWERDQNQYGTCKLEGLSVEKAGKLKDTLINIFETFEGMETDRSAFEVQDWIFYVIKETITDEELEAIINQMVNKPFDTIGVPRFDFQNVNFPLFQHFLSKKYNGEDLSKYRLL